MADAKQVVGLNDVTNTVEEPVASGLKPEEITTPAVVKTRNLRGLYQSPSDQMLSPCTKRLDGAPVGRGKAYVNMIGMMHKKKKQVPKQIDDADMVDASVNSNK